MKSRLKRNAILCLTSRRGLRKKVGKHKSISFDNFARHHAYSLRKHRSTIHKTVKLSVFSARVHISRKRPQKFSIEFSSGKRPIELARVHAGEVGRKSARNHFFGEFSCIASPQRKDWRHVTTCKLLLTVCANVLQKQIAKYDMGHAVGFCTRHRGAHSLLVDFVRARRRNRHLDQR